MPRCSGSGEDGYLDGGADDGDVIETRKAAVIKKLGSLPGYGSGAHFNSKLVEEGRDMIGDSYDEHRLGQ